MLHWSRKADTFLLIGGGIAVLEVSQRAPGIEKHEKAEHLQADFAL